MKSISSSQPECSHPLETKIWYLDVSLLRIQICRADESKYWSSLNALAATDRTDFERRNEFLVKICFTQQVEDREKEIARQMIATLGRGPNVLSDSFKRCFCFIPNVSRM
jgi:hypothetical protein